MLALDLLMISKYLERIGDHAVNIGREWGGVRHHRRPQGQLTLPARRLFPPEEDE